MSNCNFYSSCVLYNTEFGRTHTCKTLFIVYYVILSTYIHIEYTHSYASGIGLRLCVFCICIYVDKISKINMQNIIEFLL